MNPSATSTPTSSRFTPAVLGTRPTAARMRSPSSVSPVESVIVTRFAASTTFVTATPVLILILWRRNARVRYFEVAALWSGCRVGVEVGDEHLSPCVRAHLMDLPDGLGVQPSSVRQIVACRTGDCGVAQGHRYPPTRQRDGVRRCPSQPACRCQLGKSHTAACTDRHRSRRWLHDPPNTRRCWERKLPGRPCVGRYASPGAIAPARTATFIHGGLRSTGVWELRTSRRKSLRP